MQAGRMKDESALRLPETCPFGLDALLREPWGGLETIDLLRKSVFS